MEILRGRIHHLEKEIERLRPAAHFLRTRDALHQTLRRYVNLTDAVRAFVKAPNKNNQAYLQNELKRLDGEIESVATAEAQSTG